jgi:hypothetical protein
MASCLSSCLRYIRCPQLGLVQQLLKANLEEVLLDGQLSLQLSEVHTLPTAGACAAAVKTNLGEVLIDGQLSLQLSEVGIHESYADHSWVKCSSC